MGKVVKLAKWKEGHHPGYLTGLYIEAWKAWNAGINPVSGTDHSKPATSARWNSQECAQREIERRREDNEKVKKSYRLV